MDPGASSPLLQCLAQLGQDTVTQLLLPKLLEQGSGPALAATCRQLQVLVHSNITDLVLQRFWRAGDPGITEAWTAALPDHFPSCNHVCLEAPFPTASHSMPYVISTLARLPNLDAISIKVTFTELPMAALSTVLHCMCTQLTGLKSLTLQLRQCDAPGLGDTWQELGRATQLTALDVQLLLLPKKQDDLNDYLKDAAALSALQRLLVLRVTDWCSERNAPVDWSFVSCLTALTELSLASSSDHEDTAAISSCTTLRDLTLNRVHDASARAALAQLTGLTRLNLLAVSCPGPAGGPWQVASSQCAQALSCLTHLRWLGAGAWAPELLPVLQGLPQLSTISGEWMPAAAQLGPVQVPQVCTLLDAGGCVPLQAFPRLGSLQQRGRHLGIVSDTLPKLATCCPQLHELEVGRLGLTPRLRIINSVGAIVGLQSLSGLQHVQHMKLEVCSELQLAAAASACGVLAQGSLRTLHVEVSDCRFNSLLVLSKLAGLDVLQLELIGQFQYEQQGQEGVRVEDAALLLSGLSAVRKVIICCWDKPLLTVLRGAPAWAAECGLSIPYEVDVVVPDSLRLVWAQV